MKRSIATFAALAGLLVCASTAAAGEAIVDPSTSTPTTVTTVSTPPTTSSDPSTTSSNPPSTTTSTPPTTTTTTPPTTTGTPTTPTTTDDCVTDCIPTTPDCVGAECVPSGSGGVPTAVGAGMLPFTGLEDVIAPILLALTVLLGGVVAWRWAQLREAVAAAASRRRPTPTSLRSGYTGATRQLEIEQRARRVFEPRVA